MAHTKRVVYQDADYDLTYELKKCKECSCSRCSLNGTPGCYIEIAIKEINRYEQAMDSIGKFKEEHDYINPDDTNSAKGVYGSKNV